MKIPKEIRDKLEAAIRNHFAGTRIVRIIFKEVEGRDDEPLLMVTVVYQTPNGLIDPRKAAGIGLTVQPTLDASDIEALPVFSFIAKAEAGRIAAGT
jgi:hypothetical protein